MGNTGGNAIANKFYDELSLTITSALETRNKAHDTSELDASFVEAYSDKSKSLLDLGSGSGLLINRVYNSFRRVVAVERCLGISKFIVKTGNVLVLNQDIMNLSMPEEFDVVTIFGVMNYFNEEEAQVVYKNVYSLLKKESTLIIKHQFGVNETVNVNSYSEELQKHYFSQYRTIEQEVRILNEAGLNVIKTVDIYPPKHNRWTNTHFYALVCEKM